MDAAIQEGQQVVGHDAFDALVVAELEAHPKSVELGPGKECFAFGFKIIGKVAHEINAAHILDGDIAMLALRSQQVNRFGVSQFARIQVPSMRGSVQQSHDDFFESGGWGA